MEEMQTMPHPAVRRRRGSSTIEFVLVSSLFLVPLILGLFSVGFGLIRAMSGIQLTRDVGHMWAGGVDFSKQANQNLMASQLAQGLSIVSNSGNVTGGNTGNGVVVFSIYTNLGNSCPTCTNANHIVLMRRVVVGNNTVFTSAYGVPLASSVNATSGDITNYSNDVSARADNFTNLMSLNAGEIAYFTESFFTAPDLALPGLFPGLAMYSNAIF
jgi:hypothetical protein